MRVFDALWLANPESRFRGSFLDSGFALTRAPE
jgi:hypothetical protein